MIFLSPVSLVEGIYQELSSTKNNNILEYDIIELLNNVNESILYSYIEKFVSFGSKDTGSENCNKTAEWIKQEFEKLGLFTYFDDWEFPRAEDRNVIAIKDGTDIKSDAVIVLCAHYDTIGGSPGANDDGSGIATLLAIANITRDISFNHTIRFAAFSGEEIGTFGSLADAQRVYDRDENIYAVLSVDMIGYADTTDGGKNIYMFNPERAEWIYTFSQKISEKYEEYIGINVISGVNYRADHQAFIDYGYDAAGYIQSNPDLYPWMHNPDDTIDKINFSYLVKGARLILAVAVELACKVIDVQIRIVTPYEGYLYFFKYPILRLPGFNLVRSGLRGMTYIIIKSLVKVNISTEEEIDGVTFAIDGDVWWVVRQPPYEWRIKKTPYSFFPIRGKHILSVHVITKSGKMASDEMDIFVIKLI